MESELRRQQVMSEMVQQYLVEPDYCSESFQTDLRRQVKEYNRKQSKRKIWHNNPDVRTRIKVSKIEVDEVLDALRLKFREIREHDFNANLTELPVISSKDIDEEFEAIKSLKYHDPALVCYPSPPTSGRGGGGSLFESNKPANISVESVSNDPEALNLSTSSVPVQDAKRQKLEE